jgi:hypothetical protein
VSWEPHKLPHPREIQPGAKFQHKGSTVEIEAGKHGDADRKMLVNGRPISHELLCLQIVALYVAEERYRKRNGKGKGGEYLVPYLASAVYWARKHLNKDAPQPGPGRPLG